MPIVFSRSVRSIETDGYRRSGVVFGFAFALAAIWTGWFALAHVAVIEVAETARLEVNQAAHSVEAPVSGKITVSRLALGQEVRAGDVLVELDVEPLQLAWNEQKAQQAAFEPQLVALRQQIEAEERALEDHRRVTRSKVDEADARRREVETAAELAALEMKRTARLRAEGLVSEADALKAKADAEQRRSALDGTRLTMARIESEQRAAETERRAALARLRRELAQLDGQNATSVATLKHVEHDIGRRQIRAPITGRLGEVATLHVGAVVKEGEKLGAIVPSGNIRIVAEYLPQSAVGRIRPGQSARMRPDGFPWTEYGVLAANVTRVASEPRSGRMRVELDVHLRADSRIPAQHGLPGTLEIEIERVTPAVLVLRAAGRRLAAPTHTTHTTQPRSDSGEGAAPTPDRP